MGLYLITYDLRAPGRNYSELYTQLNGWKAGRVAESVWVANLVGPSTTIRDILKKVIDTNDRLVVAKVTSANWAAWNAIQDGVKLLQTVNT